MIRVPKKLVQYVDFEEGEIIATDLPPELEEDFLNFKKIYEETKKDKYTDY